jgi:hypothetical protein
MMRFDSVLKFALVPSILYLLVSVVAVALTTHYWILTDWVIPRGVVVATSEFDDRTKQFVTDDTIVYFTDADTDATIVSGCLNLAAAVIAIIAWSTLRKPGMDSVINSVGISKRIWRKQQEANFLFPDHTPFLDTQYCLHVSCWGYHGHRINRAALYETG